MEKGIIVEKENHGTKIVAVIRTDYEEKQVFASLESMSLMVFDDLEDCEVGDEVKFLSSFTGDLDGEELNYIEIL